jgi:hypothetical protein
MTPLEQRIAEAVRDVLRKGAYQMPDDTLPYETCAAEVARAVVAVLPTADVSDDEIDRACDAIAETGGENGALILRGLLDAQAAAHAAKIAETLAGIRANAEWYGGSPREVVAAVVADIESHLGGDAR